MTANEISARVLARVDDSTSSPVSVSAAEVLAAINEGQELAALLTLCLEKSVNFTVTAATCWFDVRETQSDYLVPLFMTISGTRIRPATLSQLDSLNSAWQATAGDVERYATIGCNLLAVTPQPAGGATAVLTYAHSPATLIGSATPEIPAQYHPSLADYAIYRVRLKEGAQGLARGLEYLNRFLDDMQNLGDAVRARSVAAMWDIQPFELRNYDRSRMISEVQAWQAKSRQRA